MRNNTAMFIGGSGRCGTTVLQNILSSSEEVVSLPEFRIFSDPDGLIDFYSSIDQNWNPLIYDRKYKSLKKFLSSFKLSSNIGFLQYPGNIADYKIKSLPKMTFPYYNFSFTKHCPNYMHYVNELLEEITAFKFEGHWTGMSFFEQKEMIFIPSDKERIKKCLHTFVVHIIKDILENTGSTFFLSKNPFDFLNFHKIIEILPSSRLLHIYRDPRDVVCSLTKNRWAPSDYQQAISYYKGVMNYWLKIRTQIPKDSIIEIKFEDFIENTKNILEEICNFFDIPFSLRYDDISLEKHNMGRWQKELGEKEQELFNNELRKFIEFYKYE
jgi:hypothetical protein